MEFTMRLCRDEDDYWRIRNFLREVFLHNGRIECDTHVALLDHWRWHYIATCGETGPVEQVTTLWETGDGELAAVLHPICHDEIQMHIHPRFRTPELQEALIAYSEVHHSDWYRDGQRILYAPVFEDDALLQELLTRRGFIQRPARDFHWRRDLDAPLPDVPVPDGYIIRSMGAEDELPARSWCSWRAFHASEPDENYDGDYSWYRNMQSAPLYRRDLDIVAAAPNGEIAAFCTISYDDYTRSAVIVLEGIAAEHTGRGLGAAMVVEGLRRLKNLGCTRLFAIASEESTRALYRAVMQDCLVAYPWTKIWNPNQGA
jgi:RimJ/RimL family protein N-acetyltransferase